MVDHQGIQRQMSKSYQVVSGIYLSHTHIRETWTCALLAGLLTSCSMLRGKGKLQPQPPSHVGRSLVHNGEPSTCGKVASHGHPPSRKSQALQVATAPPPFKSSAGDELLVQAEPAPGCLGGLWGSTVGRTRALSYCSSWFLWGLGCGCCVWFTPACVPRSLPSLSLVPCITMVCPVQSK